MKELIQVHAIKRVSEWKKHEVIAAWLRENNVNASRRKVFARTEEWRVKAVDALDRANAKYAKRKASTEAFAEAGDSDSLDDAEQASYPTHSFNVVLYFFLFSLSLPLSLSLSLLLLLSLLCVYCILYIV